MLWIRGWGVGGRGRCLRFEIGGVVGARAWKCCAGGWITGCSGRSGVA